MLVKESAALFMILVFYEQYLKTRLLDGIGAQEKPIKHGGLTTLDDEAVHRAEVLATTPDMIRRYGYPVETHTVITEDGYLLTVHRIPGSPRAPSSGVGTPVLVMHGMLGSSDTFVQMGPEQSLGFLLADQGYDVWLGNARGNWYSRKHVTLSPEDPKFWHFSWHEMGVYDLPAVIDHILNSTNHQQISYVGYSMGTTMFFVLTSTRPEYNAKIRFSVNMAPAVYATIIGGNFMRVFLDNYAPVYWTITATGAHEMAPRVESQQSFVGRVCREGNLLLWVCTFLFSNLLGFNEGTFDAKSAHVLFSHLVAGGSTRSLTHYVQLYATDRFQVFDPTVTFGKFTPEYNLSQISVPVMLIYAETDILFHPDAVMRVKRNLPNVVRIHRLPDDHAGHSDFVFANNAKQLVYDELINEMNRYSYILLSESHTNFTTLCTPRTPNN